MTLPPQVPLPLAGGPATAARAGEGGEERRDVATVIYRVFMGFSGVE